MLIYKRIGYMSCAKLEQKMLLSKAALYFDEVARRGSIRHASERLNIAASAIDRQILQLERVLDVRLYERLPTGIRLTAAGEMAVDAIRRANRDFERLINQIDELRGLRRGEVQIATAEGAMNILGAGLCAMRLDYPGIVAHVRIMSANAAIEAVDAGEVDIGLTFNAPALRTVRIAASVTFRMGIIVPLEHALAHRSDMTLAECGGLPLVVPDDSISLRRMLDQAWARTIGGHVSPAIEANSLAMLKSLVRGGAGIGVLSAIDVFDEVRRGELLFIPLIDDAVPMSVLTIVSDQRRALSTAASLLLDRMRNSLLEMPSPALSVLTN